jgi:uncharacterized membrane protein YkoI
MTDNINQTDAPDPTSIPTGEQVDRKPSRRRSVLIAGGSVLAAAALIGGGVAVGAAIADDFESDDQETSSDAEPDDADSDAGDTTDAAGSDDMDDAADADTASGRGTVSVSELLGIIEIAAAQAEGEPVSIENTSDGEWDVEFVTPSGDETEVRVRADGNAAVVSTEAAGQDEQAPETSLDAETLEALMAAALADTDGTVIDIEIDDDTTSPYDVTVLTAERTTVDIALDSAFSVVATDAADSGD